MTLFSRQSNYCVLKLFSFLLLVLTIFFVNVNPARSQIADSPYPMYLHDLKHTGRSGQMAPQVGDIKWSISTGGEIWSSPIVGTNNTIFVSSTDGNLFALNSDGTVRWSYQTGGELFSTPAIGADGTVYVGDAKKNSLPYPQVVRLSGPIMLVQMCIHLLLSLKMAPSMSALGMVVSTLLMVTVRLSGCIEQGQISYHHLQLLEMMGPCTLGLGMVVCMRLVPRGKYFGVILPIPR